MNMWVQNQCDNMHEIIIQIKAFSTIVKKMYVYMHVIIMRLAWFDTMCHGILGNGPLLDIYNGAHVL